MRTRLFITSLLVIAVLSLAVVAVTAQEPMSVQASATANLVSSDGNSVGIVSFTQLEGVVLVTAQLNNLTPGFHGFHVHAVGSCESTDEGAFMAAGAHFNLDGMSHANHTGDLPSLLVLESGAAYLSVTTDRFSSDDLFDEDGSAIIVHSAADNFANIPERYGTADEETLNTGDSGTRVACGVIQQVSDPEMEMTETAEVTPES